MERLPFNPMHQQAARVRGIFRVMADNFALLQRCLYILMAYAAFGHPQQGVLSKYQDSHVIAFRFHYAPSTEYPAIHRRHHTGLMRFG